MRSRRITKKSIHRTTISIPIELRERMDQVSGINWSAVAAEAFDAKLREINGNHQPTPDNVIIVGLASQSGENQ